MKELISIDFSRLLVESQFLRNYFNLDLHTSFNYGRMLLLIRRGVRVVECACLENKCLKRTGGSNPPLSATLDRV